MAMQTISLAAWTRDLRDALSNRWTPGSSCTTSRVRCSTPRSGRYGHASYVRLVDPGTLLFVRSCADAIDGLRLGHQAGRLRIVAWTTNCLENYLSAIGDRFRRIVWPPDSETTIWHGFGERGPLG